jgi:uncharacterized membrane protein
MQKQIIRNRHTGEFLTIFKDFSNSLEQIVCIQKDTNCVSRLHKCEVDDECIFFFFPSASSSSFFQAVTLAKHTAPVSLAASVFTIGFLMLTTTAFFMVDTSDWFVSNRGEIVCILYSGAALSALAIGAIAWSISKTGPVLASSYAPFQPIATVILSYVLLKETLYVGSFIGAILIVMGLYLVAWGQRAAILAAELLPATQDDDGVTSTTPTLLNLKEPLIVS